MEMSNQQKFSETLLRQINDLNSRNLVLQSQLAQKEDQLNNTSRLLQNAMATQPQPSIQALQQHIFKLQQQLQSAQEVNATSKLRFDSLYKEQQKHMSNVNNELAITKAELGRMRSNYAALERQCRAVKSDECRQTNIPVPSPEEPYKQPPFDDGDEDDEEPFHPGIKPEPQTPVSGTGSGSGLVLSNQQSSFAASSATLKSSTKKTSQRSAQTQRNLELPRRRSPSNSSTGQQNRVSQVQLTEMMPIRKSTPVTSLRPASKKRKVVDLTESREMRKRSCTLSTSAASTLSPEETKEQAIHEHAQKFCFTAVVRYDEHPGVEECYDSIDIEDCLGDLWDVIRAMEEMWCEAKGEEWKFEFEEKRKDRPTSSCVSTTLKTEGWTCGKSVWRRGCEGKFACKKCVQEVKPCFIWNGEKFKLLPLHEEDRTYRVKEGFEVRQWLNVE